MAKEFKHDWILDCTMVDSPVKDPGQAGEIEITPEMVEAGIKVYRLWAEKNLFGDSAIAADEPEHIVRKLVIQILKATAH
ncbi:MAG: hypothetical protein HY368_00165 [Candidatus Aenigmarchaeota archaeon]|nr:hypothetical protein [Candidatus Aenigmarchaeota archaeon]